MRSKSIVPHSLVFLSSRNCRMSTQVSSTVNHVCIFFFGGGGGGCQNSAILYSNSISHGPVLLITTLILFAVTLDTTHKHYFRMKTWEHSH